MARRLKDQNRSEYDCGAKVCPKPADLARFPELLREVRNEWLSRLYYCRSGAARARRAAAMAGKKKR